MNITFRPSILLWVISNTVVTVELLSEIFLIPLYASSTYKFWPEESICKPSGRPHDFWSHKPVYFLHRDVPWIWATSSTSLGLPFVPIGTRNIRPSLTPK